LVGSWNQFVTDSTVLQELSPAEVWVYGGVWMPFPFSSRDVLMHCSGMDLLEEAGCYLVTCHSDDVEREPAAKAAIPHAAKSRARVDNLRGTCIKIVPLPPALPGSTLRSHVTMLVHNHPRIPYVPQLLVDFGLHVLSPYVYKQVRRLLHDNFAQPAGQAPYQRRLQQRPRLYQRLRHRTEQMLEGRFSDACAEQRPEEHHVCLSLQDGMQLRRPKSPGTDIAGHRTESFARPCGHATAQTRRPRWLPRLLLVFLYAMALAAALSFALCSSSSSSSSSSMCRLAVA